MRCATHHNVETNLQCGKCGKPICPKCLVQTPVGARCQDCARPAKLPTYRVSRQYYFRAVGTGVGIAIVCGVVWGVIEMITPFFSLNLLLAPAVGYAIGEVVGLAVNRKRGTGLAVVAGVSVALSYVVTLFFGLVPFGLLGVAYHLAALALGIYVAIMRVR